MKYRNLFFCLLPLSVISSCVAQRHAPSRVRTPSANLAPDEARTVALHAKVLPTVVAIQTATRRLGEPPELGLGTGVLISADSHVLTAAHVVDGADVIQVKTLDGKLHPASILFSEAEADVALLRLRTPDPDLPHAELGDSDHIAVGQQLMIIGNPRGLANSLSVGHISGFRDYGELYDGTILLEFIQTDAAINSGNSGGPAFDSAGHVVGIASRILSHSGGSEGLGFVVAINTAKQLLALNRRAWTGMRGIFFSGAQLKSVFNLDRPGGLLLQSVAKGSPADKAGLRGGTIAAKIGGRKLLFGGDLIQQLGDQDACHAECLVSAHARLLRADRVAVTFLRGGKLMKTELNVKDTRKSFLPHE